MKRNDDDEDADGLGPARGILSGCGLALIIFIAAAMVIAWI
jgi:hypothetical protein